MRSWYSKVIQRYPLTVKSLTSGFLFCSGDILAQTLIERKTFDIKRNTNLLITGIVVAPIWHVWYCKVLPKFGQYFMKNTSKGKKVFGKMMFQQLVFAPILISLLFPFMGFLNDRSIQGVKKGAEQIQIKLWDSLKANWLIWPLATTINLYFMPLKYQVLFANVVGVAWSMILSYILYK